MKFRTGLLSELTRHTDEPKASRIEPDQAIQLVNSLGFVQPAEAGDVLGRMRADHRASQEDAVRLILFLAWSALGESETTSEMEQILAGSWAGEVLERMKVHHRARKEAIARHLDRNDPVKAEARREEKKRQRKIRHAERLAAKRERDRAWRAKNGEVGE